MTPSILHNGDWLRVVALLGGAERLERTARVCGAFQRARRVGPAQDLLRLCLAYGPGGMSLRGASAWARASGLAQLCGVSLLERLRKCGSWLGALAAELLARAGPGVACDRPVRIVDGSVLCPAGAKKRGGRGLWRLHAAIDAGAGRFSDLVLTDQSSGERFDRAPVVAGEIRLAGRACLQPGRLATVLGAGADVLVRAGWKGARWCDAAGARLDLIALPSGARGEGREVIGTPLSIARKGGPPVTGLRLIAIRKSDEAARISCGKARKAARQGGHALKDETLAAAQWFLPVTPLDAGAYPAEQAGALHRLRWRIEIAFKRLKGLTGYRQPPGKDPRLARVFLLAHLLPAQIADGAHNQMRGASPSYQPARTGTLPGPVSGRCNTCVQGVKPLKTKDIQEINLCAHGCAASHDQRKPV